MGVGGLNTKDMYMFVYDCIASLFFASMCNENFVCVFNLVPFVFFFASSSIGLALLFSIFFFKLVLASIYRNK